METTPNPNLDTLRHSAAHVMAQAVTDLFTGTRLAIGPSIEDGFYYDFDLPRPITAEDLPAIEARMCEIIASGNPFVCRDVAAGEARALLASQPYKLEILEELERAGEPITLYSQNGFVDLCRGPHLRSTGEIPVDGFKLLSVSGAYWRGDEHRERLQRIYGTAWPSKEELERYLWRREEAHKRDHRVLGMELDLFSVSEDIGPGLILWHPKGAMVRMLAEEFSHRLHHDNGYQWVYTPHIGRSLLWETSGHLDFFRENMYAPMDIDGEAYYAKPMNCPFHIGIYKSRMRSYRDLPQRYVECGSVYRYERSGVLHGLTRVRGFTIDDAHIFCNPDEIEAEIRHGLQFNLSGLRAFGLSDFICYLSTRPDKAVGADADWERATNALRSALDYVQAPYRIDEGGGAFYGPKVDIKARDALGRLWQLSTIQFDFNLPERFGLEFIGQDGCAHRPYMVHRALFGSIERFLGVLIEHYGGAFPIWLAPVQAVVIPVSTERHQVYADEVASRLRSRGLRAEIDGGNKRMQAKIRDAQLQKVPYMLIVGDREVAARQVAVRSRSGDDLGAVSLDVAISRMEAEVASKM